MLHVTSPSHHVPSPGTELNRGGREIARRWTPRAAGLAVLTAVAIVFGLLLLFTPYTRGIVGTSQDGSPVLVDTTCDAPVIAVGNDGSRSVDSTRNWVSDDPPCQRSAGFRIGLAGLLLACAGGLAYGTSRERRPAMS